MIFRSPSWLRDILDFEIYTGEDIKGVPSKKQKRKLEKQKLERERKEGEKRDYNRKKNLERRWNNRWESMDREKFKKFYRETFGTYLLWDSDFNGVRSRWQDKMSIWKNYDEYLKVELKKEQEQNKITSELNKLYDDLISDYRNNKFHDKIKTPRNSYTNAIKIIYTFENGNKVEMDDNTLVFTNKGNIITYTVGINFRNKFVNLFNQLIEDINKNGKRRPTKKRPRKGKVRKNPNHPKRGIYDKLVETVKKREEDLGKMDKNDPERESLTIDLNNAKSKMEQFRKKYGFE